MPREATDSICYINGKAPCGRSVSASGEWGQEEDTGSQTQEPTQAPLARKTGPNGLSIAIQMQDIGNQQANPLMKH